MRAYTAWVIQKGRARKAEFLVSFYLWSKAESNLVEASSDVRAAMQFCRRSDARRFIEGHDLDGWRPVEKTFG